MASHNNFSGKNGERESDFFTSSFRCVLVTKLNVSLNSRCEILVTGWAWLQVSDVIATSSLRCILVTKLNVSLNSRCEILVTGWAWLQVSGVIFH